MEMTGLCHMPASLEVVGASLFSEDNLDPSTYVTEKVESI